MVLVSPVPGYWLFCFYFSGKELFIQLAVCAHCYLSIYDFRYSPFGFMGRSFALVVLVQVHF